MPNNIFLIKDKSPLALSLLTESEQGGNKKRYIYKGVFTPCTPPNDSSPKKNRNGRIYDEAEVLRHLPYLRERIRKEGSILGELDHPEGRFEVYLKEASHKITDLWYDPEKHAVMGKLEILDTPNGRTMKAIVDAGCPLFVSSRAAGTVGPDSHVTIQQIFTYDIVSTPGFEECRLDLVSESMRPKVESFINESVQGQKKVNNLAVRLGVVQEDVQILESTNKPNIKYAVSDSLTPEQMAEIQKPISEAVKVKLNPEKARELGLTNDKPSEPAQPVNDGVQSNNDGGSQPETPKEHTEDEIIDIEGVYGGSPKDIEDITPEYDNNPDTTSGDAGSVPPTPDPNNPFNESEKTPKPKKGCNGGVCEEGEPDGGDVSECGDGQVSECGKKGCKPGKKELTEDADNGVSAELEEPTDKDVDNMENKKNAVKKKTEQEIKALNDNLEGFKRKNHIRESIIEKYKFAVSLSPENFNKFARMLDNEKKMCADFIAEQQVFDIKTINEIWDTPVNEAKAMQKNYLNLASDEIKEIYHSLSPMEKKSIDALAECYILESKSDVDEFWQRTGLLQREQRRIVNEQFCQDFKNMMSSAPEGENPANYGQDRLIAWVGEQLKA